MKMPPPSSSLHLLACWIQFHEHTRLKGVRLCGPDWVVDLRDLRGYKEVIGRIPPLSANCGSHQRKSYQDCIFAVMDVLAMPGRYGYLLRVGNCSVAAELQYCPLSLPNGHDDLAVTRLLAAQGLTTAAADDAWQYCYHYLKSVAGDRSLSTRTIDRAENLLASIDRQLLTAPHDRPMGLKAPEADRFRRPSSLPTKRLRVGF